MKPILTFVAWAVAAGLIIYAVTNPQGGVAIASPLGMLGTGFIGLALCMQARNRALASRPREWRNPTT